MKRIFILIAIIILMAFSLYYLSAQDNQAQKKETTVKPPPKTTNASGKVRTINPENSMIFIVTSKGEDIFFVIDDKTKITKTRNISFEEIKQDDAISASYETETGANTAQSVNVRENNPVSVRSKK